MTEVQDEEVKELATPAKVTAKLLPQHQQAIQASLHNYRVILKYMDIIN